MSRRRGVVSILMAVLLAVLVLARPQAAQAATLSGVDISGWNTGINYSKLGDFVIVKATEYNPTKKNYTSYNNYQAQADAALKAGKLIGFYHFATNPSRGATIKQQAQGFIDAVSVKDAQGNYKYLGRAVLCLDWEDTGYSKVQSHVAWAKEWLDYVYEKTGILPVIYTSKNVTNDYNWSSVAKAGYKLWGAMWLHKYDNKSGFVSNPSYTEYGNWGAWGAKPTIYQYSSSGKLHGGKVYDVNKFYGSKNDWLELAYAGECAEGTYDPATLLEDGAIYSFSPSFDADTGLAVANVSNNAQLGSATARSYLTGYWRVQNHGDGTYSLVNLSNNKPLSFASSPVAGSNVSLTGATSLWKAIKCSNGAIALAPDTARNLRLDVLNNKRTVAGTNIQLYKSNGKAAQRFFFTKAKGLNEAQASGQALDGGVYALTSALDASKYVEIAGSSTTKGANVQLGANNNKLNQRFQLVYKGGGLYTIRSYHSDLSFDVKGGSKTKGANVQQYKGNSTLAQLWYLKQVGGNYSICSALSGLALDAAGGKSAAGTNIQIYTANGTKAQQFALTKIVGLTEAATEGQRLANGTYRIVLAGDGGETDYDVSVAESASNGANVQLASQARSRTQKFELTHVKNGLYTVRSQYALKVLDVKGGSSASGANVQQWKSNGSVAQLWYLVGGTDGYQLRSAMSGNALTIEGDVTQDGANLCVMTPDDTSPSQRFLFQGTQLIDEGDYVLSSKLLDTLSLASRGGSTAKGANVQVDARGDVASQRWTFVRNGDGTYTIRNAASGLVLDVQGGSTAKGVNVRLWTSNGTVAQRWKVKASANGGIVLTNAKSGMVLDVAGGKKVAGTNVQQWKANGSVAQSFLEHAVDEVVEEVLLTAAEQEEPTETVQAAPEEDDAAAGDEVLTSPEADAAEIGGEEEEASQPAGEDQPEDTGETTGEEPEGQPETTEGTEGEG